ncbi:MAG: undecaprenyl-diphosphate phosphatase [Candidatus Altimarinota bacterium]
MTTFQALILGAVQGVTEFLPISSSGHLVLVEEFFGLKVEHLLSFDVVLHAGTLVALLVYFWKDLLEMLKGLWIDLKRMLKIEADHSLRDPEHPREQVWYLIVATLPIVLIAPFLKDFLEQYFRTSSMVVMMLGVTAVFLAIAEIFGKRQEGKVNSIKTALVMGLFQVLAVTPGISRSGSTIVGGLLGGLTREAAARFSFLMAIPAIGGATVFILKDYEELFVEQISLSVLSVGFFSSVVMSFLCMHGMLKYLRHRSLWVFVAYLVLINGVYLLF